MRKFFFLPGFVAISLAAQAQIWVGGSGNNVSTAANWNPAATPANDGSANLAFPTTSFTTVNFDTAYNLNGLTFSGTATYGLNGSALTIGSGGIAHSATVTEFINNTLTLGASATFATTAGVPGSNLTFTNTVANGGNTLTLNTTGGALSLGGNLSGTGALTVNGSNNGVVFLSGTANSWSGTTTVNSGGTLQFGDVSGVGVSIPGNITDDGTVNIKASASSYALNNVISGTGRLQFLGTNTVTLNAAQTYSGTTTIGSGTVVIAAVNALPTSSILNLGATAILDVAANQTINQFGSTNTGSSIKIENNKSLTVALGALTTGTAFNGTITDGTVAGGQLIIGASTDTPQHTVTLTNTNTYTGGTSILSGGVLRLGANSAGGSVAGNIANDGLLIFHRNNGYTFNGVISGSGSVNQGVTSGGTGGTTVLTAANTYTGGTLVSGGLLLVGNSSGSATGTGAITVTPAVTGAFTASSGAFGGAGTSSGALTVNTWGSVYPQGTLNIGPTTMNAGTRFAFKLADATAAMGTGYGTLAVNGALTLNATPTAGNYLTIAPFSFNGSSPGQAANFDTTQNYSFTLANSTGITGFDASAVTFDFSNFQNAYTGTWSVTSTGSNLVLNYTGGAPIPEPAISCLFAGLLVGGLALRRRQKLRAR